MAVGTWTWDKKFSKRDIAVGSIVHFESPLAWDVYYYGVVTHVGPTGVDARRIDKSALDRQEKVKFLKQPSMSFGYQRIEAVLVDFQTGDLIRTRVR